MPNEAYPRTPTFTHGHSHICVCVRALAPNGMQCRKRANAVPAAVAVEARAHCCTN